ncbi:MAG: TatD family hydrolase [Candidatus Diapherotrites archaeon]
MFVDSHCHLDWFEEPEKIAKEAKEKGLGYIISCSTNLESVKKNLQLAELLGSVKIALALHPSDLLRMNEAEKAEAMQLINENISKAVAVGETGLDFKHAKTAEDKALQGTFFGKFIALAKEKNLPLIVHSRFAESKCIELLEREKCGKVLMHWFKNSEQTLPRLLKLGFFASIGPSVFTDAQAQKLAIELPLDRMLLETDSPVRFSGKTAVPAWIPKIAEKVAELKGVSAKEVAEKTTENAKRLFGLE